jgi:signal transduction histidine kinase
LKLLTRSTYYYSVFSILATIAAGILLYFTIRAIVYKEIDDSLITEKTIIQDQIEETDLIPDFNTSFGHLIEVRLLNSPTVYSQLLNDTDLFSSKTNSYLPFRHLSFSGNTRRNTGYTIDIFQVLDEKQELLDSISLVMFFLFFLLLLVSLFANYLVSKRLWSPFFNAVNEAAKFNILSDKPLEIPDTSINEFRQLKAVLEQMTNKMRLDYINLKEYNENSSHEIQTPLAVIRSKLDILMQNKKLNKESINLIKSINEATTRLFKLNQGLLLISKIENLQFPEIKEISLKKIIEDSLYNYEEIMQLKKIKVETYFADIVTVRMNETLADIMISNILSNAVRYNIDNGYIICRLDSRFLTITNSGTPLEADPANLFMRFRKGTKQSNSVGLGLSIVKKIVDHYNMEIDYTCSGTVHEIKLTHRPERNS